MTRCCFPVIVTGPELITINELSISLGVLFVMNSIARFGGDFFFVLCFFNTFVTCSDIVRLFVFAFLPFV